MKWHTLEDLAGKSIKQSPAKPPNWPAIIKVFPRVEHMRGVLFCYGGTIYNPDEVIIPNWLIAHETVHMLQQEERGGPEKWWHTYLESPHFRLSQETDAHWVEYRTYCLTHNRHMRQAYLANCAERLSGQLYGYMIKTKKAKEILKGDHDG